MIDFYQETTPEPPTPAPTPIWFTPTPRPTVEAAFDFITGDQIEMVIYDFTDDMVAGYNSVREPMDIFMWFILAAMVGVMAFSIFKRFKEL